MNENELHNRLQRAEKVLSDLVDQVRKGWRGEENLHQFQCTYLDNKRCTCGAQAVIDAARAYLAERGIK